MGFKLRSTQGILVKQTKNVGPMDTTGLRTKLQTHWIMRKWSFVDGFS